ncbi:MAG TPA: hypothetical protein VG843_00670 [Rhizomicrobium sp.]|nr:hypothetical protein [Rhizomicrobium sp.]
MADINENLTVADFYKLDKSIKGAFDVKPAPKVVRLDAGFELYKITVIPKNKTLQDDDWVSPWWCPMKKYLDDTLGAIGRFYEAGENKISMSDMTRFMAAVRIDWNEMSDMLQIKLKTPAKGFWGKFAPQPLTSPLFGPDDADKPAVALLKKATADRALKSAKLPAQIGTLEAWQFYIPNLKEKDIERVKCCDAHDMEAVGKLIHNYYPTDEAA